MPAPRRRMLGANFWTDSELLSWPLGKRMLYFGLSTVAEDSGCVNDSPTEWKFSLFPADEDLTVDLVGEWRDQLVAARKLVEYSVGDKAYLYIRHFSDYQTLRHGTGLPPRMPLPPWVVCTVYAFGNGTRADFTHADPHDSRTWPALASTGPSTRAGTHIQEKVEEPSSIQSNTGEGKGEGEDPEDAVPSQDVQRILSLLGTPATRTETEQVGTLIHEHGVGRCVAALMSLKMTGEPVSTANMVRELNSRRWGTGA